MNTTWMAQLFDRSHRKNNATGIQYLPYWLILFPRFNGGLYSHNQPESHYLGLPFLGIWHDVRLSL